MEEEHDDHLRIVLKMLRKQKMLRKFGHWHPLKISNLESYENPPMEGKRLRQKLLNSICEEAGCCQVCRYQCS
jgi:lipoate synthase